jgi:hypothetical protein
MKQILATFILILAATTANAGGFYQMVTSDGPVMETGTPSQHSGLAPLQEQVQQGSRRIAEREIASRVAGWSYSPLYLQVTGNPQSLINDQHAIARGF